MNIYKGSKQRDQKDQTGGPQTTKRDLVIYVYIACNAHHGGS